jgi:hypothetical protein
VLPLPGPSVPAASEAVWSALPAVEFPTFRAACRRHLSGHDFARVDVLYRDAFERVGTWMTGRGEDPAWLLERVKMPYGNGGRWPLLEDIGQELTGWLRDEQLGPARDPGEALVVLRATPASLLRHAIWLCWDPAALGADPAGRLPGTLTPSVVAALYGLAGTEQAAATALSLHLNHPPSRFLCWKLRRCRRRRIGPGGTSRAPPSPRPAIRQGHRPGHRDMALRSGHTAGGHLHRDGDHPGPRPTADRRAPARPPSPGRRR